MIVIIFSRLPFWLFPLRLFFHFETFVLPFIIEKITFKIFDNPIKLLDRLFLFFVLIFNFFDSLNFSLQLIVVFAVFFEVWVFLFYVSLVGFLVGKFWCLGLLLNGLFIVHFLLGYLQQHLLFRQLVIVLDYFLIGVLFFNGVLSWDHSLAFSILNKNISIFKTQFTTKFTTKFRTKFKIHKLVVIIIFLYK